MKKKQSYDPGPSERGRDFFADVKCAERTVRQLCDQGAVVRSVSVSKGHRPHISIVDPGRAPFGATTIFRTECRLPSGMKMCRAEEETVVNACTVAWTAWSRMEDAA